jgi:hypothetical protein
VTDVARRVFVDCDVCWGHEAVREQDVALGANGNIFVCVESGRVFARTCTSTKGATSGGQTGHKGGPPNMLFPTKLDQRQAVNSIAEGRKYVMIIVCGRRLLAHQIITVQLLAGGWAFEQFSELRSVSRSLDFEVPTPEW